MAFDTQRELHEKLVNDAIAYRKLRSREAQRFYDNDGVRMVVIPESDFLDMTDELDFLQCLRDAGVDNWSGYDDAQQLFREEYGDDDE